MNARVASARFGIMRAMRDGALTAFCLVGGARLLRWLSRRAFPGAVRVLYCHDVLAALGEETSGATAPGALSASELEQRVVHIKRHYGFATVDEAVSRLRGERPARGMPVVLTFDDGYLSFARSVYPILRQHGIPAALCVATGAVGGSGLWTDEVRDAVQRTPSASLRLSAHEARLGDAPSRSRAAEALLGELKRMPDEKRRRAVFDVCARAGQRAEAPRRMLNWDELRQLARDPLITIGAHTVTHPILARMTEQAAEREMRQSREILRQELGIPVTVFSYPNGRAEDFTEACERMAAAAGYRIAFSTTGGLARPGCDLYAVPRNSLALESWSRFVLRMAGLDELRERVRSALARRPAAGAPRAAVDAQVNLPRVASDARES